MTRRRARARAAQLALAVALVLGAGLWPPAAQGGAQAAAQPGPRCVLPVWSSRLMAPQASSLEEDAFLFGVGNDAGDHFADEWQRGVRATTFELHWMFYEPQEGVYDQEYIARMQALLADLKAQGWHVQLVPGYQYTPQWVYDNYPDMRYVNQYGDAFDPGSAYGNSYRVTNAPFNPQARALIGGYLARIFQDFDPADFDSVRVGGGVQGELRYPPSAWNGHANSYWAFDAHAQNPDESGIPTGVVDWRPGIDPNPGSVGRGQLLVNPGFEDVHAYFAVPAWSPDEEITAELDAAAPYAGERALRVTLTTPYRVHQFVRVQPDALYRFGGWLRSGGGGGRARAFFEHYDAAFQPVDGAPYGALQVGATEWTYASGALATLPATQYLKVELDGSQPGIYYFDDLWLERDGETNHDDRDIRVPLAFYDWYVQAQTDFQAWQMAEMRKHYDGQLDLVYAGKGILPNRVTDALTNDLRGDGWSEGSSALYAAALYDRHVAGLDAAGGAALYLTGIDEPHPDLVDDSSPYPGNWSAARWIAFLARSRGLPVWAENSGQDDATKLWLSAQRMRANGMLGLMWVFESELYADPNLGAYASIDQYAAIIKLYNSPFIQCLPIVVRND